MTKQSKPTQKHLGASFGSVIIDEVCPELYPVNMFGLPDPEPWWLNPLEREPMTQLTKQQQDQRDQLDQLDRKYQVSKELFFAIRNVDLNELPEVARKHSDELFALSFTTPWQPSTLLAHLWANDWLIEEKKEILYNIPMFGSFVNKNKLSGRLILDNKDDNDFWQTEFTHDEIMADPELAFLESKAVQIEN